MHPNNRGSWVHPKNRGSQVHPTNQGSWVHPKYGKYGPAELVLYVGKLVGPAELVLYVGMLVGPAELVWGNSKTPYISTRQIQGNSPWPLRWAERCQNLVLSADPNGLLGSK
jgi:hypothetical protein